MQHYPTQGQSDTLLKPNHSSPAEITKRRFDCRSNSTASTTQWRLVCLLQV